MGNNIFKGTFIGLAAKLISSVLAFVIIPMMLKQLGNNNFGIWLTISSAISLLAFMDFGLGNNLMGFIAKNENDIATVQKHIGMAYTLQLCFVAPLVLLFLITFNYINWQWVFNISNPSPDLLAGICITFVFFLLGLISSTIYAIQRGLQQSDVANTWQLISSLLSFIILYISLSFCPSFKWVAFASTGVPVLVSGVNTLWFLKKNRLLPRNIIRFHFKDASTFLGNSALLLYLQVAALIAFQTDALILAHYASFTEVSIFSIVAKLFSVPVILLNVYLQVLWPAYTKAFAGNNFTWIKNTFYKSLLGSLGAVLLFLSCLFFVKDILLTYWLNSSIQISGSLFLAFSVWLVINALDANIAIVLNGLQLFKIQAYLSVIMVITNLLLSVYLVKSYGVAGVVWGTSISTLLFSFIPLIIYLQKRLKSDTVGA